MARRRRARSPASHGALAWLLAGVLAGLLLAGGVWWLQQPPPAPDEQALQALMQPRRENAPTDKPSQATPGTPPEKRSTYDFYHLLPRMEVPIPEEELASAERKPRHQTAQRRGRYVLQVGAFRTHRQADELKARLALLGFEAQIVRTRTDRGTWHRVRLGPFASLRELDRVRHALQKHHIDALALKLQE